MEIFSSIQGDYTMKRFAIITISLFIALYIGLSISHAAQYDPVVYQAQKALKVRGYDPGKPDGLWGKSTESAIKHFQVDNDLPVTGKLDEQTKAKLGIVSTARSVKRNQPEKERRIALVIGNSDYKSSPLINPVNDAQDMAAALINLGFEVIHKQDAGQREMEESIRSFGTKLRKGGVGLFYYAGHGMQIGERNYLIPTDAEVYKEIDVKYESVDAGRVLDEMHDAGNGLNIVLLDACRDNPFARSFRTNSRGLARMDAPTGTFIAYATAPGSIAADGEGRNGIFTRHLLKNMSAPGFKIEDIMKQVRIGVMQETRNRQVPWQASSLTGNFYFASGVTPEPQTSTQLADERAELERERQELERLKLEIERRKLATERKRLEEELKKNTIVASIDPKDREIGRDDHYIAYTNGIVRDTKIGLEWLAGPDKDTSWGEAKKWIDNLYSLSISGGKWRMPTPDELKTLYEKDRGTRNMTPLLKTTGWMVWSGETKDSSSAWSFTFYLNRRAYRYRTYSSNLRAFAVRSRR